MKRRIVISFIIAFINISFAQYKWERVYGGSGRDQAFSIALTPDGGYIAAGLTASYPQKCYEMYAVRTDDKGDSVWIHNYGSAFNDYCWSITPAHEGGYMLLGATDSILQTGPHDVYLIHINENGDSLWSRVYGDTTSGTNTNDVGRKIKQTDDGGYIIVGMTNSYGAGSFDIYLIKINAVGDTQWTRTYGTTGSENGWAVEQTDDAGYIIAGTIYTSGFGNQIWILRTDSNGDTLWTRSYGGPGEETANDIDQCLDKGYVFAGSTGSYGAGNGDVYVVKTDSLGNVEWEKVYGYYYPDWGNAIEQTADGNYIVIGGTRASIDPEYCSAWLLRLDHDGDTLWTQFKTPLNGEANGMDVKETADQGYVIAAICWEYGGQDDFYLIKTDSGGLSVFEKLSNCDHVWPVHSAFAYPNPFMYNTIVMGHEHDPYDVYNTNGQLVGTYSGTNIGCDLAAGVYFLSSRTNEHDPLRIVKIK